KSSLNSLFQATKENIPDSAWIYYTSKNNFLNIYPWVPSDKFQFSQELYTHEFYRWGLPSVNPERKAFWTPVYIDEYGQGAMVTAVRPVYRKDEFLGTVAIDITLDKLTDYLHEFKKTAGMLMIVNERNQLITHSNFMLSKNDSKIYELADGLPEALRSKAESLFENQPM
ncbi:MAG: serine/threonine protein phosphatase, partial [Candidatus Electrothrix sp. AUS1_2]|nr:serine/threonine protein phosphatase [Candidatus Electrothrix sp. AUS1_2]